MYQRNEWQQAQDQKSADIVMNWEVAFAFPSWSPKSNNVTNTPEVETVAKAPNNTQTRWFSTLDVFNK